MKEIFKDIEGYEGVYSISNMGNVKSLKYGKERILKPIKNYKNYLIVNLCKEGKHKLYLVHRLVAEAFIENPNKLTEINHKDENKQNNRVDNLEWCNRGYNVNYGTRNQRSALSRSKQVLCVETGLIYISTMEVQRQLGFSQGHISSACNGKRKTCGGYTWKYVV